MHSSWYSRRRIDALGSETSSGAVAGAKAASRRTPVDSIHAGRRLRRANKLRGVRCIPHIAGEVERACLDFEDSNWESYD